MFFSNLWKTKTLSKCWNKYFLYFFFLFSFLCNAAFGYSYEVPLYPCWCPIKNEAHVFLLIISCLCYTNYVNIMRAEAQFHNIYKGNSWKGKGIVIKPHSIDSTRWDTRLLSWVYKINTFDSVIIMNQR